MFNSFISTYKNKTVECHITRKTHKNVSVISSVKLNVELVQEILF